MSAITELLSAKKEDFVQRILPKGDYLCQIIEAELMHGYWGKSNRWFEAYVPTIEVVDYFPSGDDDIDQATLTALGIFGDWKGYKPGSMNNSGRWTTNTNVPGYEERVVCANPISGRGLVYPIIETTPNWEHLKDYSDSAARFFNSENHRGELDGFVVRTLSTDPVQHTPPKITPAMTEADDMVTQVIAATKGCYLIVSIDHEQDEKGDYPPKLISTGVSSV